MKPTITRAYEVPDFELRGGDGRTLIGLAAPFNTPAEIFEHGQRFAESIAPGAFARTIQQRAGKVPLFAMHESKRLPLGPVKNMTETGDGLRIEARISKTQAGDEVLELIRDGALGGLSIGFAPIDEQWSTDNRTRVLREVALHEVSVVHTPAYSDALIGALRSLDVPTVGPSLDFYDRELWLAQEHTR